MLLHPVDDGFACRERQVKVLAVVGDEREAQQRAADAVIFGIEEVPQRGCTAAQLSVGNARPLRQRSWAMRS